jgi:hypothetical protein
MVDPIVVAVLIGAGLVFVTGAVIGVIVMVAVAVRREDTPSAPTGVGRRDTTPPDQRVRHE